MPFSCGQAWAASTYNGHWPDQDSIDFGEWNGSTNMSEREPVLASADGEVLDVFTDGDGGNRVYIDHGDGWVTHYLHLAYLPPLTDGQQVAQGQVIGHVGNSGTEAMHLHYTQLQDGAAVRSEFDGTLVSTHAGNMASWNTWDTSNAEKLTSYNCPQESFTSLHPERQPLLHELQAGHGRPRDQPHQRRRPGHHGDRQRGVVAQLDALRLLQGRQRPVRLRLQGRDRRGLVREDRRQRHRHDDRRIG